MTTHNDNAMHSLLIAAEDVHAALETVTDDGLRKIAERLQASVIGPLQALHEARANDAPEHTTDQRTPAGPAARR